MCVCVCASRHSCASAQRQSEVDGPCREDTVGHKSVIGVAATTAGNMQVRRRRSPSSFCYHAGETGRVFWVFFFRSWKKGKIKAFQVKKKSNSGTLRLCDLLVYLMLENVSPESRFCRVCD